MMKSAITVSLYIARAPKAVRGKLREMRAAIKSVAPKAREGMSYGMPYYAYKGRLVYFRHWKNHIGLYVPTPVVQEHARELKKYETEKATVRFPVGDKLPVALIQKLVRARMRKNDEAEKKQNQK